MSGSRLGGDRGQVPEYNPIRDSGHDSGDFVFFRLEYPNFAGTWIENVFLTTSATKSISDPAKLVIKQEEGKLSVKGVNLPSEVPSPFDLFGASDQYNLTVGDKAVATGSAVCHNPVSKQETLQEMLDNIREVTIQLDNSFLYFRTRSCNLFSRSQRIAHSLSIVFQRASAGP
jgi:hypothetical protein